MLQPRSAPAALLRRHIPAEPVSHPIFPGGLPSIRAAPPGVGVQVGEKHIALGAGIDFRHVYLGALGQHLPVHRGPANDKRPPLGQGCRRFRGIGHLRPGDLRHRPG